MIIYMNLQGNLSGAGGPTIMSARLAQGFVKRGHRVIYDKPNRADVCLCIIESGKTLRKVDRKKTKVVVRLDGAYYKGYWHSQSSDRMWRPDMDSLHKAIQRDVKNCDHMVYQSQFSKDMIDSEIARRDDKFSIIHNGTDPNSFKMSKRIDDGFINIFHHGVIRNDYIVEGLFHVYDRLKKDGVKVRLVVAGKMDGVCNKIFNSKKDQNTIYLGSMPNNKIHTAFDQADIGVYNRQGSSNDGCVIESLMSGVPVVIPSFGGNVSLVNNGYNGFVVDSKDWNYGQEYSDKIAEAIHKIIPDLHNFKVRARKHAVKNLNLDLMIDRYLKAMNL